MAIVVIKKREDFPKEFVSPHIYPVVLDLKKEVYWDFDKPVPLKRKKIEGIPIEGKVIKHCDFNSRENAEAILSMLAHADYFNEDMDITVNDLTSKHNPYFNSNLNTVFGDPFELISETRTALYKNLYNLSKSREALRFNISAIDTGDLITKTREIKLLDLDPEEDPEHTAHKEMSNCLAISLTTGGSFKGLFRIINKEKDIITVEPLALHSGRIRKSKDFIYPLYPLE